jgi:hypothetical protein
MKTHAPLLLAFLVVAVAGAASAGDESQKPGAVTVNRLVKGDCPQYLRLGEGGPGLLRLGRYGYLGVETTALTPELRRHFGAPEDTGVLIGRVEEGSPAAAAGLRVGDVLTRVDDGEVTSGGSLRRLVRAYEKDETATLEFWRGGKSATTTVAFDERQSCALDLGSMIDLDRLPRFDLGELPLIDLDELAPLLELREFDGAKLDEARERLRKAHEIRELDADELKEAQERLREALRSQDWSRHLERLRDVDMKGIEERLREAMERLHELEHEIETQKERIHRQEDDGEPDALLNMS